MLFGPLVFRYRLHIAGSRSLRSSSSWMIRVWIAHPCFSCKTVHRLSLCIRVHVIRVRHFMSIIIEGIRRILTGGVFIDFWQDIWRKQRRLDAIRIDGTMPMYITHVANVCGVIYTVPSCIFKKIRSGYWNIPEERIEAVMKILNVDNFLVVKAGRDFETKEPVDIQDVVSSMEKNESYIYWMQRPAADVQTQVASVRINGRFYYLNMKLEKAIFRHVRLTKNFHNVEVLPDGTRKLRIPIRLFNEKLRTSNRFEVCHVHYLL